ncbi:UPF0182 family protein [Nocardioides sp. W7]|uniref:UPF0182 family membrane protein n=1 Tax=Nocardioides sp. W7 TaxID=2931390 RepID=UPI001FD21741|nr:UPF0182 family protein [Nocardioides sp. W7]
MSELFDQDPRDTAPPPRSARSRALIVTAVVLVLAFFGLTTFASIYTDRLWFNDTGYGDVFSTLLWTRVALFLVFGVVMALAVGASMYVAYRTRPLFHPNSPEQTGLDRYREAVTPIRTWLLVGISVVLGVFAGTSGVGQWRNYLLWRNGVDFDQEDAEFGRDIGFFVFDLPWLHFLVDFAMAVLVVSLIASLVVNYLYGGIRLQSPGDRLSGAAQAQLSVLVGLFVLVKGLDYWLDRFDVAYQSGGLFDGVKYTDANAVLPSKNILIGIAVICAVLFFVNVWRRTWMLPSVGIALLAVSAILLGMIWPAIMQQFQVKPSEADKEEEYIARNIEATRAAYDLDDIVVAPYSGSDPESDAAGLGTATTSVPLVDPQLVSRTFQETQQGRAYYSVADVLDVDRYELDGEERALVLGARELNQDDLNDNDKNWSNLHTVYTHGNGIIAAYANQRGTDNQSLSTETQWAEGNQGADQDALTRAAGPDGYESRIYFGEDSPEYSVVGKADEDDASVELGLAGATDDQERATTYDGAGGVPVGSTLRQLMYGIKFGETNFLLSGRVNGNSEVIYNRTPRERVEKVAPWLTIDDDAYPAIVDGKVVWILDGYTTTDRYPGAEKESFETMTDDSLQQDTGLQTLPTDEINYMRNAVKATVDAYDGTVTLYGWDEDDPILKAWRGAFPGTVVDKDEMSPELLEHIRYPEDLFKVQRYQFARYHVTDAGDWYQGNDRWQVPEDPNTQGNSLQPPYRLFVDVPSVEGEDGETIEGGRQWSLTSNFVPFGRNNLASFATVNSDATSEDYGTITVLQMQDQNTSGPSLIANEINADENVRDRLRAFETGQSPISYGNILTVPIANGLMHVEPIYAVRVGSSGGYPILQYVVVSIGDEIGIGTTLTDAIGDALTGISAPPPGDEGEGEPGDQPTEPQGSTEERIRALLARAEAAFAEADAALAEGNLAGYEAGVKKAQQAIDDAVELSGITPSPAPTEESPAAE